MAPIWTDLDPSASYSAAFVTFVALASSALKTIL